MDDEQISGAPCGDVALIDVKYVERVLTAAPRRFTAR
jgi:hypothetical protein